ncbi:hypothetical protein GW17_00003578 [Ensete ventricosum]|nr:hypothetical protein GW17_00003578 [Ensete ventricosum]
MGILDDSEDFDGGITIQPCLRDKSGPSPRGGLPTLRVESYEESSSFDQLRENLDFLKKQRVEPHLRALTYKKAVARLYNQKGKLAPNREGPYRIISTPQEGTCTLSTMERRQLPRTWHIRIYVSFMYNGA